ncbi:MAG: hypothetical protein JNK04_03330 [Myxococcales bacterium]|nr:hypothetical protein [Myxococcales bacterium]
MLAVEIEALGWAGRFEEMSERASEAIRVLEPGSIDWCSAGAGLLLLGGASIPVEQLLPIVGSVAFMPLHANASLVHIRIHAIVALLLYRAGQLPMADNVRERLLPLEEAPETTRLTRGWIEMVKVYASRFGHDRKPHVTRDAALAAASYFEAAYDLRSQAFALVDAAYAELAMGRIETGLALANRGRELASRLGIGFVALYGGGLAANALGRLGRMPEARALAREVADASSARKDRINVGFTLHLLAVVELLSGDYERARDLSGAAAEQPGLVPPTLAYAYATSARAAARLGDAEEAMRCATRAVDLMNTVTTTDMAEGWVRLAWIEALTAVGRMEDRAEAVALAQGRLEERASGMTTVERTAFFSLPEHAETLALSAETT